MFVKISKGSFPVIYAVFKQLLLNTLYADKTFSTNEQGSPKPVQVVYLYKEFCPNFIEYFDVTAWIE